MQGHQYRITVAPLGADGLPHGEALAFDAPCHDDMLAVAARLKTAALFDDDTTTRLAVGLKLFGEVLIEQRAHPLFAPLAGGAFADFMRGLKTAARTASND
ncbi:DUF3861 domain-containing protein [Crenobacter luteus]|uniref:DUF3861 domain-containing protein n=1 Tax=Crenobacter luteus TaxID=1452487 RepID=A0A165G4J3_9NEIS|nr:DUF3861 domain-containing protein [Crenobacter luteus]KZE35092.1 hypothetical protein AVW16_04715 [Crenobacter luteus]